MLKGIPINLEDFKEIIETDCYYVDKTKFIEELLKDRAKVKLFCRPRRFGKTLNMSTLKYFFDIEKAEENRKLFEGLYIGNSPYFKEQGKYPVIFLTMKGITSSDWQGILGDIREKIFKLCNQFDGVINSSLSEVESKKFQRLLFQESEESELKTALTFLTSILYKHYKQKVIVLIDEYDSPILTAFEKGYYTEMRDFFKSFYGDVFKTNEYLQMGILTGIIRVAQAGIFSDLNNLKTDIILNTKNYSQYFGLLESEVEEALKYYEIDYKLDDVKEWYNGYTFGNTQVYNPWSILNYLENQELIAYWVNTSSNYLIREILKNSNQEVFKNLEKLFNKEELLTRIENNVEVHTHLTENEIYSLMLYSGYLTLKEKVTSDIYSIRIPNKEIMSFFHTTFISIVFNRITVIDNVKIALITRNLKLLEESIEKLIMENLSSFDKNKEAQVSDKNLRLCLNNHSRSKELLDYWKNSYHMFLLGFLVAMKTDYEPHSNIESGYGRADIILEPLYRNRTGYILELKLAKDEEDLKKKAEEGARQIELKKYTQFLESKGVKDIVKIGVAFEGKKVEFRCID